MQLQIMLNRISRDYPAIPKIYPIDGVFGESTERAVIQFQKIFNLTPDGVVGNATWYKMVYLYVGILDLAELISEGQMFYGANLTPNAPDVIKEGDTGEKVRLLQYMLAVISEFYDTIPTVKIDGVYGPGTKRAVIAIQQMAGLPQDGVVGQETWEAMYRLYAGITENVAAYSNVVPKAYRPDLGPSNPPQFPGKDLTLGDSDAKGENA